jgi:hypothetical protein
MARFEDEDDDEDENEAPGEVTPFICGWNLFAVSALITDLLLTPSAADPVLSPIGSRAAAFGSQNRPPPRFVNSVPVDRAQQGRFKVMQWFPTNLFSEL